MISCCMIMLDEEFWVAKCLNEIRTYPVDEIIVVDGGSTDFTLDIIKNEYPEVKLYHHPMPLSFSEQRNIAKSYATSDWILSLDADETLENAMFIPRLIEENQQYLAFSIPTRHMNTEQADVDPHIRLFRNQPNINWFREVHEYLTLDGVCMNSHPAHMEGQAFTRYTPEVTLVHWAYTAPEAKLKAKAERYMKYNQFGAGIQINSVDDLLPNREAK